jgi:magnesium chelatase subunit D
VYRPDTTAAFQAAAAVGPYPEDTAPPTREPESLRLPLQRYRARAAAAGPPIGTRPATDADLRDLALVATILEAAKFQAVRRAARQVDDGRPKLLLSVSDLRSYVRAPLPDQVLVVVLDYTCLAGRDWEMALLPHLRWAYQERAAIRLIQVGARGAAERLRAEQLAAANVLAPRLGAALQAGAGGATPLAHGLDLAVRGLRSALQHGRASVQRARLVVVSDGRGNVPLAASRAGRLDGPVGREGIDDALAVARIARGRRNLESVVLDPQPAEYPELPTTLAEALGAVVEAIPERAVDGASVASGGGR